MPPVSSGPPAVPRFTELRRSDREIVFWDFGYNYVSAVLGAGIVGLLFGSGAWALATELPRAIGGGLGLAVGIASAAVVAGLGFGLWLGLKAHLRYELHVDLQARTFSWIRFSMFRKPVVKRWTAAEVNQVSLAKIWRAGQRYGSNLLYVDFKDGSWLRLDECSHDGLLMPLAGALVTGLGVPLGERRAEEG